MYREIEHVIGPYSNDNYLDYLVDSFESPVKHYDQVEDAVVVLRKTLAEAEVSSQQSGIKFQH